MATDATLAAAAAAPSQSTVTYFLSPTSFPIKDPGMKRGEREEEMGREESSIIFIVRPPSKLLFYANCDLLLLLKCIRAPFSRKQQRQRILFAGSNGTSGSLNAG